MACKFGNLVVNVSPASYLTHLIWVVSYRIVCPLIGSKKANPLVDTTPHQLQKIHATCSTRLRGFGGEFVLSKTSMIMVGT